MPALLGAGSEFIPVETLPHYNNEVFKLDSFTADSTLVGYIFGGISSTAANVFFTNTGTESSASSQIFKVYLINNSSTGIHALNTQSSSTLQMQVYPNPNNGRFIVKFMLKNMVEVKLTIQDANGKLIENTVLKNLQAGENTYAKRIKDLVNGGVYFITLETNDEKATQKIIVEP